MTSALTQIVWILWFLLVIFSSIIAYYLGRLLMLKIQNLRDERLKNRNRPPSDDRYSS